MARRRTYIKGKGDLHVARAVPSRFPAPRFNTLPLLIALFCLLWSFAFVAGKIGVTDCPPLILLAARFPLAGILILGHFSRCAARRWSLSCRDVAVFALLGVANNALYLGLGYTGLQDRLGRSRRPDRQRQSGVHRGACGDLPRREPDLAQGRRPAARHRRRRLHRLASHVGRRRQLCTASCSRWRRWPPSSPGTILFKVLAPKGNLWLGNGVQNLAGGLALLPFASTLRPMSATSCRAGACSVPLPSSCCAVRSSAYLLWFHLLKVCGATAASAYHFLMPPLAMLFAWMVLGEHVALRDLLGIIPVALGIYLVTRPAQRSENINRASACVHLLAGIFRVRNRVRFVVAAGTGMAIASIESQASRA